MRNLKTKASFFLLLMLLAYTACKEKGEPTPENQVKKILKSGKWKNTEVYDEECENDNFTTFDDDYFYINPGELKCGDKDEVVKVKYELFENDSKMKLFYPEVEIISLDTLRVDKLVISSGGLVETYLKIE